MQPQVRTCSRNGPTTRNHSALLFIVTRRSSQEGLTHNRSVDLSLPDIPLPALLPTHVGSPLGCVHAPHVAEPIRRSLPLFVVEGFFCVHMLRLCVPAFPDLLTAPRRDFPRTHAHLP